MPCTRAEREQHGEARREHARDRRERVDEQPDEHHRPAPERIRQRALHERHQRERHHVDRDGLLDLPVDERELLRDGRERRIERVDGERAHHRERREQCCDSPVRSMVWLSLTSSSGTTFTARSVATRRDQRRGSSLRSSTSTSAEPTMTPSTWPLEALHLLAAANAEARAHGQRRCSAHAIEIAQHFVRHGHVLAGGAGHGDGVDESLAALAQPLQAAPASSPA